MKTVKAKHISEFNMNDWAIILRLVRQEIRISLNVDVDLIMIEDAIIDMAFEKAKRALNYDGWGTLKQSAVEEIAKDAKET